MSLEAKIHHDAFGSVSMQTCERVSPHAVIVPIDVQVKSRLDLETVLGKIAQANNITIEDQHGDHSSMTIRLQVKTTGIRDPLKFARTEVMLMMAYIKATFPTTNVDRHDHEAVRFTLLQGGRTN